MTRRSIFKQSTMALLSGAAMLCFSQAALAANGELPSREEMWQIIQQQQKEIDSLKKALQTTDDKVEATGAMVEEVAQSGGAGASGGGWWDRTSIGGYGELHYNAGDDEEIDFHRFVLFMNHDFTDDIHLFSELELEHALSGDGEPGEVELEQAFVEFDFAEDRHHARAGVFLLPVGILNETHEPPTFFGVERNPVEKNIIPTTWWEGGVGARGELGSGFSYNIAAHSGLSTPTTGNNAYKIRNGRQKVAQAEADDLAYTANLNWSGYPGVELGVTGQYQDDVTQGNDVEEIDATLFEAHADLRHGGWGLRGLYARWDLDGSGPDAIGRDEQVGWYLEPSYRFETDFGTLGVFGRYNEYDNNAGSAGGDTQFERYDVGINYWPHPDVVLKADYNFIEEPDASEDELFNLGIGFQF